MFAPCRRLVPLTILATFALLVGPSGAGSAEQKAPAPRAAKSDRELIANATSAAPPAVGRHATVVAMDEKGQMRTLRKGTGTFTCIPDNPMTPGNDPMCLDKNGMEWAEAWMSKTEPPADKVGFGYMLRGGSDASNEDPYATKPAQGKKWVDTGPHVMIFNVKGKMEGYPSQAADTSQPYIMWPGTPYEHLMIPVGPPPRPARMSGGMGPGAERPTGRMGGQGRPVGGPSAGQPMGAPAPAPSPQ